MLLARHPHLNPLREEYVKAQPVSMKNRGIWK